MYSVQKVDAVDWIAWLDSSVPRYFFKFVLKCFSQQIRKNKNVFIPGTIQFLSSEPCGHDLYSFPWFVWTFVRCLVIDSHFSSTSSRTPLLLVALQYIWLTMDLVQSSNCSHVLFFPANSNFFLTAEIQIQIRVW